MNINYVILNKFLLRNSKKKILKEIYKRVKKKKKEKIHDIINVQIWNVYNLNNKLLDAIQKIKFSFPTSIQYLCLNSGLESHKDIFCAAQTSVLLKKNKSNIIRIQGSGKTLAFSIPIIEKLFIERNGYHLDLVFGLIIEPTRELAIQVFEKLKILINDTTKLLLLIGGFNEEKQKRLLNKKPEIVVATPGRFLGWKSRNILGVYLNDFSYLRILILDEADRLLQNKSFSNLKQILLLIKNIWKKKYSQNWHQSFIFSATLTLPNKGRELNTKNIFNSFTKNILIKTHPLVLDLTTSKLTADILTESIIRCSKKQKNSYLYYFLTQSTGRTIIFINTISTLKKISQILNYLKINVYVLHAHQKQKQRLKQLNYFISSNKGNLLCTDVASRGLDILKVENVVQYHVPRSVEIYINRSGRTARANDNGFCLTIQSLHEKVLFKKFQKLMNIYNHVPYPINHNWLKQCTKRLEIIKEIEFMIENHKKLKKIKFNKLKENEISEQHLKKYKEQFKKIKLLKYQLSKKLKEKPNSIK